MCNISDAEGPLAPNIIEQKLATGEYVAKTQFAGSRKHSKDFLSDHKSAAISFISCIDEKENPVVINAVSEMLVSIVNRV
jgi:hypothetical protein